MLIGVKVFRFSFNVLLIEIFGCAWIGEVYVFTDRISRIAKKSKRSTSNPETTIFKF